VIRRGAGERERAPHRGEVGGGGGHGAPKDEGGGPGSSG
jgi:hypothetical protein